MRAMNDVRLTGLHWRVLAVIASHDRLGRSGAGCWASQRRLAELARCYYTRLSDALSDLVEFGYVSAHRHPKDRRRRIYRVIYNDADREAMDLDTVGNTSPFGELSKRDTSRKMRKCFASKNISAFNINGWERPSILRSIKIDNKAAGIEADCAEALPSNDGREASEAEKYLANVETLAASSDPAEREVLRFEIHKLAGMADDAALPEQLCERASRLLRVAEGG
jgi:hypothetical protein